MKVAHTLASYVLIFMVVLNLKTAKSDPQSAPQGEWTAAVWLNDDATKIVTNIEEEAFNTQFTKCPVVQYTRNGAVHSVYIRTSPVPASFNAFAVFTNKWISTNNQMDTDFRLYDNLENTKNNTEVWTFCNYNDNRPEDDVVGYPRDCGKEGYVGGQWFRMPDHQGGGTQGSWGITSGIGFDIYSGPICPASMGPKLEFQLKGLTGEEKVSISIDGNDEEFVLTTEWQTFSYPRPSKRFFSVEFHNDNGPRDVNIQGHESQVVNLLPVFTPVYAQNEGWGCGTVSEDISCTWLRNGELRWDGKYTYILKG